jgi:hypothetical protein
MPAKGMRTSPARIFSSTGQESMDFRFYLSNSLKSLFCQFNSTNFPLDELLVKFANGAHGFPFTMHSNVPAYDKRVLYTEA